MTQTDSASLKIDYVMERPLSAEEASRLAVALSEKFGYRFAIVWNRVERIERSAGGKYEDFVSMLT